MSETTWLIKPHDTIMFRDARPFEAGASAHTMQLPWPSTLAGFVRSRYGRDQSGTFKLSVEQAKKIAIKGPWVVQFDASSFGKVSTHYFPAPHDAVCFKAEGTKDARLVCRRLAPVEQHSNLLTDLPDNLQPVGFAKDPGENPGKPTAGPALWTLDTYRAWLDDPWDEKEFEPSEFGMMHLPTHNRIHVSIDPKTYTALEGHLFQTSMLETTVSTANGYEEFGFGVQIVDASGQQVEDGGADVLGGERRIVHVEETGERLNWPAPKLSPGTTMVRAVLLTPGLFERGFAPKDELDGAKLVAAKVGRGEPLSGWSIEDNGPKPARLMAPAGSVYWFELEASKAQDWVEAHHLTSICDHEQDRRDGFGLIAIGQGGIKR